MRSSIGGNSGTDSSKTCSSFSMPLIWATRSERAWLRSRWSATPAPRRCHDTKVTPTVVIKASAAATSRTALGS